MTSTTPNETNREQEQLKKELYAYSKKVLKAEFRRMVSVIIFVLSILLLLTSLLLGSRIPKAGILAVAAIVMCVLSCIVILVTSNQLEKMSPEHDRLRQQYKQFSEQ